MDPVKRFIIAVDFASVLKNLFRPFDTSVIPTNSNDIPKNPMITPQFGIHL
jgi:hypothetical protein